MYQSPIGVRPFGATGIQVSEIGLGAWQLGRSSHWPDGPSDDEAVRLVHAAIDAGVTFIDTAPGYADGRSEVLVGRALRTVPRENVVLCTKFGYTPEGKLNWAAEAITPSVENSARRMGTDHIDIVVLHSPPPEVLDGSGGHYEVLRSLRGKGLIRAYGASVDTGAEVDTMLRVSRSQALELRMSALYQEPAQALRRAAERGVGAIIKVPLESGWLTGKYTGQSVFTDVRARWGPDDVAYRAFLVDRLIALLPPDVSLLGAALGFLLADPAVTTVIPGTKSVAQLERTLAAVGEPLTAETVEAIRDFHRRELAGRPLRW